MQFFKIGSIPFWVQFHAYLFDLITTFTYVLMDNFSHCFLLNLFVLKIFKFLNIKNFKKKLSTNIFKRIVHELKKFRYKKNHYSKNYSTIKIMNICCLNVSSKIFVKFVREVSLAVYACGERDPFSYIL